MADVDRPDYVKDEHIKFLNRRIDNNDPVYAMPYTKQVSENFSIPEEVARQIVNYWFKTLDDEEE